MVEYRVKHHTYPALVRLLHKNFHGLVITKIVVYFAIVSRVIFMVRRRLINRRCVDACNAQILQIVKLIYHSLYVSAIKIVVPDDALIFPWLCVFRVQ